MIFALAANLLLPTAIEIIAEPWIGGAMLLALVSIIAPLIAGAVTASYTRQRGGMHAFLGARSAFPSGISCLSRSVAVGDLRRCVLHVGRHDYGIGDAQGYGDGGQGDGVRR